MANVKLFGYADKISVRPGDTIDFYVTADGTREAEAQLVRLIHGDQHPSGPGYVDEEISCVPTSSQDCQRQVCGRPSWVAGITSRTKAMHSA
jgi:N,N-dimethylformamidase